MPAPSSAAPCRMVNPRSTVLESSPQEKKNPRPDPWQSITQVSALCSDTSMIGLPRKLMSLLPSPV